MPYVQNSLTFTIETLVGLYLIAVILRFLFQLFRVDFHNPISQSIVALTSPPLSILRRFIPGFYGIDLASLVLIILVSTIKVVLLALVSGYTIAPVGAVVFAIGKAIETTMWTLLIAIIAKAILSWVAPSSYHPGIRILDSLTEPVLSPFRRLLPGLGGLDISPIFAILALNLAKSLIAYPIMDVGMSLSF